MIYIYYEQGRLSIMSCPGCEIHRVVHGVTKKADAKPRDEPIPTSSKSVRLANPGAAHVIDIEGDRTIPEVAMLDGSDDGGSK
jgi:hypothetical protein